MCVSMHVCAHRCVCVCICAHGCVCVCMYLCLHVCAHECIHVCLNMCVPTDVSVCACVSVCVSTCACVLVYCVTLHSHPLVCPCEALPRCTSAAPQSLPQPGRHEAGLVSPSRIHVKVKPGAVHCPCADSAKAVTLRAPWSDRGPGAETWVSGRRPGAEASSGLPGSRQLPATFVWGRDCNED